MKLVVGLGNPGREYAGTRHNVGFDAVEALSRRLGFSGPGGEFDRLSRIAFDGLALDGVVSMASGGTHKVLLLKPMTYMNLSGRSVQAAMAYYRLEPADLMVVLDDLALPSGRIRIRPGGSSGGHNGLKDIELMIGTNQYPRLRIGIDAPPPRMAGKDYVLGRYTPQQRELIEPALERSAAALAMWIEKGIEAAMNQFNAEENSE